jgi:hypothetical protein
MELFKMAKSESRKIAMKDGRIVEFGEKQRMDKSHSVTSSGSVAMQIDFDNGETVVVEVAPGSPVGMLALGHGLSQKLGDAAAGAETTEDAFEAVLEIAGRVANGEWKKASEFGTSGSAKGSSELVEALSRVLGKSKEIVRELLAKLDQADKLALRKTPAVATVIETLRLERGPTKTNKEQAARGTRCLGALHRGEVPQSAEAPPEGETAQEQSPKKSKGKKAQVEEAAM